MGSRFFFPFRFFSRLTNRLKALRNFSARRTPLQYTCSMRNLTTPMLFPNFVTTLFRAWLHAWHMGMQLGNCPFVLLSPPMESGTICSTVAEFGSNSYFGRRIRTSHVGQHFPTPLARIERYQISSCFGLGTLDSIRCPRGSERNSNDDASMVCSSSLCSIRVGSLILVAVVNDS